MFLNIHIKPDGSSSVEKHKSRVYFSSTFFNQKNELHGENYPTFDCRIPNGDYIHTKTFPDGVYILIERKINKKP